MILRDFPMTQNSNTKEPLSGAVAISCLGAVNKTSASLMVSLCSFISKLKLCSQTLTFSRKPYIEIGLFLEGCFLWSSVHNMLLTSMFIAIEHTSRIQLLDILLVNLIVTSTVIRTNW